MRAALIAVLLALAAPAAAGAPLALAERQVVVLEFQQPVARISTTDPDLLQVKATGARLTIAATRSGRASLEVAFADGATVTYDVTVDAARRSTQAGAAANELVLGLAEERRFRSPGLARVLVEENGVARVVVDGETVKVVGLSLGQASLVLVDAAGAKTTWQVRVR
jgi:hypothetical protein